MDIGEAKIIALWEALAEVLGNPKEFENFKENKMRTSIVFLFALVTASMTINAQTPAPPAKEEVKVKVSPGSVNSKPEEDVLRTFTVRGDYKFTGIKKTDIAVVDKDDNGLVVAGVENCKERTCTFTVEVPADTGGKYFVQLDKNNPKYNVVGEFMVKDAATVKQETLEANARAGAAAAKKVDEIKAMVIANNNAMEVIKTENKKLTDKVAALEARPTLTTAEIANSVLAQMKPLETRVDGFESGLRSADAKADQALSTNRQTAAQLAKMANAITQDAIQPRKKGVLLWKKRDDSRDRLANVAAEVAAEASRAAR